MPDLQNTTNIDTRVTSKPGLVTDLNSSYLKEDSYSYARNIVRNSKDGDLGTLGNEPSTLSCITTDNDIVGVIELPDDKHLIFSGTSEIGVADLKTCSYTMLRRIPCLNLSKDFPVKGIAKKDFNKGIVVTFTDNNNPVRRLELDKINTVDCDDILLFKKISQPCIEVVIVTGKQIGRAHV